MKFSAIITAGGTSSRFGNKNKLLEKINDKEVIRYTIDAFQASRVDEIIICSHISIMEELREIFKGNLCAPVSETFSYVLLLLTILW